MTRPRTATEASAAPEQDVPVCGAPRPEENDDGGVLPRVPGSPAADWEGERPEDQTDG